MKRIFILLISFALFANILVAQKYDNDEMRLNFGFSFGKSQPLLDYGSIKQTNLPMGRIYNTGQDTNRISGYAQLGFHYNVYVSYKIKGHLHIKVALNGDINSYDLNAISNQYQILFPANTVSVYTPSKYYIMQYLIGPKYNLPVSKNCSIEFTALAGLITNNRPPSLTFNRLVDTIIYYYAPGRGFGYNVGVGFKYRLQTNESFAVGFHVNLSYAGSNIIYPNYSLTTFTPFATTTYNVPKHMELGILQLTLGVSLGLLAKKVIDVVSIHSPMPLTQIK